MANRRMEALRAMAEQDESIVERDIAREKLALLEAREAADIPRYTPWEARQITEQRERELTRASEEATRAELVKRWERGEFAGIHVRTGATTEVKFRKSKDV